MGDYGDKSGPPEKYGDKPAPREKYGDKPDKPGKPTQSEYATSEQSEYDGGEEGRCARVAADVAADLEKRRHLKNKMVPCEGERKPYKCEPLRIPELHPWTEISWGDSKCDCIESDDTEIMYVTVCNPYSNLTLSNFTIEKIEVEHVNGKPPALLPDGTPSIQLVPIGPYCFDDIPPCSCVTRQFIVRLRGALGGHYKMMLRGMCFEACIHGDTEGCFDFHVCKD
jgi:hypothetical protein